ncbi:MAG TPA: dephospho-CoA kinase [Burkholderiales bacterium]
MTFAVGLTGGIGSGKTTVARLFASHGAGIIDTDEISHNLTASGQPAVTEIARQFGAQFISVDGSLDRAKMRSLVFANPVARKGLEAILHPLIRQESARLIMASTQPYVIVVVPLLIESGVAIYRRTTNRILVVDCEPETQIRRVMERSGLSRAQVLAIVATQAEREHRLREADDVIHNDNGLEALSAQVNPLHSRYLELARNG